jgi:hypothetical protein
MGTSGDDYRGARRVPRRTAQPAPEVDQVAGSETADGGPPDPLPLDEERDAGALDDEERDAAPVDELDDEITSPHRRARPDDEHRPPPR